MSMADKLKAFKAARLAKKDAPAAPAAAPRPV
jgi:hypothetical protein